MTKKSSGLLVCYLLRISGTNKRNHTKPGAAANPPKNGDRKMKKAHIFMNGRYLESHKNLAEAEAAVRIYERQDRYERDQR